MLKIDKVQQIGSVTVYGDDTKDQLFYVLPTGPTFRTDESGKPIFRFIKYRQIREDNSKFFGGLVTFDTCLKVSDAAMAQVKAALQPQVNQIFQSRGQETKPVEIGPAFAIPACAVSNPMPRGIQRPTMSPGRTPVSIKCEAIWLACVFSSS